MRLARARQRRRLRARPLAPARSGRSPRAPGARERRRGGAVSWHAYLRIGPAVPQAQLRVERRVLVMGPGASRRVLAARLDPDVQAPDGAGGRGQIAVRVETPEAEGLDAGGDRRRCPSGRAGEVGTGQSVLDRRAGRIRKGDSRRPTARRNRARPTSRAERGDALRRAKLPGERVESPPSVLLRLDARRTGDVRELSLLLNDEERRHHHREDGGGNKDLGERETALVADHRWATSHSSRTVRVRLVAPCLASPW